MSIANDKYDLEIRVSQRETAFKFQINNSYSWHTFYKSRKIINKEKISKAKTDELEGLNKLLSFDKDRIKYWMKNSEKLFTKLNSLKANDQVKIGKMDDKMNRLSKKIISSNIKLNMFRKNFLHNVKKVDKKLEDLTKILSTDVKQDVSKAAEFKKERQRIFRLIKV